MRDVEVTNTDDLIDSRDAIKHLERLEEERQDLVDDLEAIQDDLDELETTEAERKSNDLPVDEDSGEREELEEDFNRADRRLFQFDRDYGDELAYLRKFCAEGEQYSDDWRHGATLINDDYFENYARGFAEDIGAITRDTAWPATCIDWEAAALELQQAYSAIQFNGTTFWVR